MKTTALLTRLAAQNVGRQSARSFLLGSAVAVCVAALFSALTVHGSVEQSLGIGFARMGADLLVVPRDTLVNLTPALLTVEPTPLTLSVSLAERIRGIAGINRVAPQRHYRLPLAVGSHQHEVDLIAFDPDQDITVLPWLETPLPGPLPAGGVLVGGRREETPGNTIQVGNQTLHVLGRLGLTGVGPFDRGLFISFETAAKLRTDAGTTAALADLAREPDGVSALLVRLAVGTRPEQIRFNLGQLPEVKVIAGSGMHTSVRQALTALLLAVAAFTGLLLLALVFIVSVLFSANLGERRRELGLLLALGTRRRQLLRMILTEAILTTGLGGVGGIILGVLLLMLFQRTLGYFFTETQVPFQWPGWFTLTALAALCMIVAALVGLLGAWLPAWRASSRDPYELIRWEGQ